MNLYAGVELIPVGMIVMKQNKTSLPRLGVFALLFTVALMFATIELPLILNRLLHEKFDENFYDWTNPDRLREFHRKLEIIGLVCLVAVIALIVVGFLTGRRRMSSVGSFAFFLPTFAYFAGGMFILAGLGLLRSLWYPFYLAELEIILLLGDIIYLPYLLIDYPFSLLGVDVGMPLAYLAIGTGLFIFFIGTLAWFYGKSENQKVFDFWIYKYSRHPQYLGFLIWSYGVMLIGTLTPQGIMIIPEPSLPWVISTLLVICLALSEEIKMTKEADEAYLTYQRSAPFMLPLPRFLSRLITAPNRLFLKKDFPTRGKEVLITFIIYLAICIGFSLLFVEVVGRAWINPWINPLFEPEPVGLVGPVPPP